MPHPSATTKKPAPAHEHGAENQAVSSEASHQAEMGGWLRPDSLNNLEYMSKYGEGGHLRLHDGSHTSPDGKATTSISETLAMGDINGDGRSDAAVVLVTELDGGGIFYNLAAVVNRNGRAVNVATTTLGDRIRLEGVDVDGERIAARIMTHAKGDPLCCPTLSKTLYFLVRGPKLLQVQGP